MTTPRAWEANEGDVQDDSGVDTLCLAKLGAPVKRMTYEEVALHDRHSIFSRSGVQKRSGPWMK